MSPRMLELREGTEWKTGRLQKSRHAIFGGRNTNSGSSIGGGGSVGALAGGAGGGARAGGESVFAVSFCVFLLAFGTSSLFNPNTPHKFLLRNGHRLSILLHLAIFTLFFSIPSSRVSGGQISEDSHMRFRTLSSSPLSTFTLGYFYLCSPRSLPLEILPRFIRLSLLFTFSRFTSHNSSSVSFLHSPPHPK